MGGVDFDLFMERYGYKLLLWLMMTVSLSIIAGVLFFWGYFTNGIATIAVGVYSGILVVLRKMYTILFGEDPRKLEDTGESNRRMGRRFFMNRF
ncbi:hypothetical protein E3E26_01190 [Thermococcus sp. LS1]|uniref:hypothetical protein n=1 Tax=Thermococcus sp. LS1 TaxID=1638259 RepID=UPI00143A0BD5|nr:hypothetical protein [Thermococcus sp. LS1]NJD98415.1 hypothetical protein [Thermococcus sp. LS1]